MEALAQKQAAKKQAALLLKSNSEAIELSYTTILRNVVKITMHDHGANAGHPLWTGTGLLCRMHRKDAIGTKDGLTVISTRNLLYNPFIARHAKITFFDPTSMLPIPPGVPLDPDTFSYLPSLYETEKATLSAKDPTKMTHHDHTLLSHLTTESAENLVLDFSANFLPPLSRPKLPEPVTEFTAVDLLDLNAPLSDISDEDSSSSSSSSSDDGGENFSMLMSSAISGADSKGAARRQRQALRAVRKKEKQKRAVEREARAAVRQQYEERKNNKKQRKLKAELYAKQATQRANEQAAKEDQKRRLRPPRASVLQQALFAAVGEGTDSDSDSDSDSSPSLPLRGEAQPTPASDPPFSPCSSTSSSDSEFGQWKPPLVSVGDTLTVLQYPDAHDAQHPHSRTVKIHVIADSKIYYRIDPTLDTHRISAGAVLIKLYPDELTYKVIGIHTGRTSTLNNKPIDWCHEGYLLTRAFMRMREDVTKQVEHDAEADSTEVKVTSANFRKMSMAAAKQDLDTLLNASRTPIGISRSLATIGPVDAERARDLLQNAEASGVEAVVMLMQSYRNDVEIQTQAMRTCVRILLGTHVQHGKYLSQVEAISKFGALGIVAHTVAVMRAHPDSTSHTVYSLWLLALMTQNAINARLAGKEGANAAIVHALELFAEFGKANTSGQRWGAACVTNMARVPENRVELEDAGVLTVITKLLDNSPAVLVESSTIISVLSAITELGRKPHFDSRIRLVNQKIQHNIRDMELRLEDEVAQLREKERKRAQAALDDESYESSMNALDQNPDTDTRKKLTAPQISAILEAIEICLDVLSYSIPQSVWEKAIDSTRKFEIDWNIVSAGLKLDVFGFGGRDALATGDIKGKAKAWVKKTEAAKLQAMRSRFSGAGSSSKALPTKARVPVRGIDF